MTNCPAAGEGNHVKAAPSLSLYDPFARDGGGGRGGEGGRGERGGALVVEAMLGSQEVDVGKPIIIDVLEASCIFGSRF